MLASTGELVAERSGVLNLGLEGVMLGGAVAGFATALQTGSIALGLGAALLAGMGMALVFAVLVLTLQTNQVATGLALTLFGTLTGIDPMTLGAEEIAARDLGISVGDALALQRVASEQLGFTTPIPEPSTWALWAAWHSRSHTRA